ncbi:MAG: hypothetical protein GY862_13185 [Gammaproteobacteria bacterium]|nr:hypothetical protein [Gammaproteobacteria bacterium]
MPYKHVERQFVFDRERDHYQLWSVGWEGHKRYHGCVLHIDIKNGKIWIQHERHFANFIATNCKRHRTYG